MESSSVNSKEMENVSEDQTVKKGRHRKKQLYNSILQQMEFYFSDSNLNKDRFLSQLVKENPYVDLDIFLKFNKMRKLTTDIEDIKKAVKNSSLIELSEDKNSICRKEPIKEKPNPDECTIYVERLKSDATHDWLKTIFSEFGKVDYVSIPKYKHNNSIKGFAFIEFSTAEEAQSAINYFESIGCKMPSNTEPEQLCSVSTFEPDKPIDKEPTVTEPAPKKRKLEEVSEEVVADNAPKKLKAESEEVPELDDTESKKKKKYKKEQKKKNLIKELGLQVLSKKEWKKMRNRYLDLQRKKMQEFKRHLHKVRFAQSNYEEKVKKPMEVAEPSETIEEDVPTLKFVEGVIVKIKLPEPCGDVKKLKNEIKSHVLEVQYVDIPHVGAEDIYIRFNNDKNAKDFCEQDIIGKKKLLEGEEETEYWNRIREHREKNLKKETKKQRGRDKLLKKANKVLAKHIKFDD